MPDSSIKTEIAVGSPAFIMRRVMTLTKYGWQEHKDETIRENAWKKVCEEVFEKIDESEKDLSEGFVYILFQISHS